MIRGHLELKAELMPRPSIADYTRMYSISLCRSVSISFSHDISAFGVGRVLMLLVTLCYLIRNLKLNYYGYDPSDAR